ncbi:hypothetical protein U0070_000943 [Myodes glareolus]|uniref:Uncharacterized protein n=1 Tax=Myodes glareolus TaxID=447135 RepID=A0AAW0H676_MYOGA
MKVICDRDSSKSALGEWMTPLVHQQWRKCCRFLHIVFDAPHCSRTLVLVTLMEQFLRPRPQLPTGDFCCSLPDFCAFCQIALGRISSRLQRKVIQFPPGKMMLALELSLGGFICGGAFSMPLTYRGRTVDFANASSTNLDMSI